MNCGRHEQTACSLATRHCELGPQGEGRQGSTYCLIMAKEEDAIKREFKVSKWFPYVQLDVCTDDTDHLCSLAGNCKRVSGLPPGNWHSGHRCRGKDPGTSVAGRRDSKDSPSRAHTLVGNPHRDCQSSRAGTDKSQRRFVHGIQHWLHRDLGCRVCAPQCRAQSQDYTARRDLR